MAPFYFIFLLSSFTYFFRLLSGMCAFAIGVWHTCVYACFFGGNCLFYWPWGWPFKFNYTGGNSCGGHTCFPLFFFSFNFFNLFYFLMRGKKNHTKILSHGRSFGFFFFFLVRKKKHIQRSLGPSFVRTCCNGLMNIIIIILFLLTGLWVSICMARDWKWRLL